MAAFPTLRSPLTALAFAAVAFAGCASPPVGMVAHSALDGVSMVATGKTTNGHGLSAITGEDCEPMRMLEHEPVCRPLDYPDSDATFAEAEEVPRRTVFGGVFVQVAHEKALIQPVMLPEFTEVEAPEPYAVIASFRDETDARAVAMNLAGLPTATSATLVNGIRFHRVLVGPLTPALEQVLNTRLANAGVLSFYPVSLCPRDQTEPPCISKPRYRPAIDPDRVASVAVR